MTLSILALARKKPEKSLPLLESAEGFINKVFGKETEYSKICTGDKIFVLPTEKGPVPEDLRGLYMFKIGKEYDPDRIAYFETKEWPSFDLLCDWVDKY